MVQIWCELKKRASVLSQSDFIRTGEAEKAWLHESPDVLCSPIFKLCIITGNKTIKKWIQMHKLINKLVKNEIDERLFWDISVRWCLISRVVFSFFFFSFSPLPLLLCALPFVSERQTRQTLANTSQSSMCKLILLHHSSIPSIYHSPTRQTSPHHTLCHFHCLSYFREEFFRHALAPAYTLTCTHRPHAYSHRTHIDTYTHTDACTHATWKREIRREKERER